MNMTIAFSSVVQTAVQTALQAALLLALSSACNMASVHMVVPPDIAEKGELVVVKDRGNSSGMFADESFVLGQYRVQKVDRSAVSGEGDEEKREERSHFSFELWSPTETLAAQCHERQGKIYEQSMEVAHVTLEETPEVTYANLSCSCGSGASLALERTDKQTGELELARARFPLVALYGTEGGAGQTLQALARDNAPTGYRVDGEALLGAVEVLHPGRVWLARDMPPEARQRLSCLFVGLLLDSVDTE